MTKVTKLTLPMQMLMSYCRRITGELSLQNGTAATHKGRAGPAQQRVCLFCSCGKEKACKVQTHSLNPCWLQLRLQQEWFGGDRSRSCKKRKELHLRLGL
jgi:hypothetical protein